MVVWSFTYKARPVAAGLHFEGFVGRNNKSFRFRKTLQVQKSLNHLISKIAQLIKIQTPQNYANGVSRTVATGVFYHMICVTWRAKEKQGGRRNTPLESMVSIQRHSDQSTGCFF